ncbi:MAG: signal peptidase I [Deltaproteobacteria bacterium]
MSDTAIKKDSYQKSVVREYAEAIAIALVLALFIRTFVIQAFKIPSGSMIPTLLVGDHILVNKFIYGIRNPFTGKVLIPIEDVHRKDVIVFEYPVNPDQDFIKRVIGLPGDTILIKNKKVYVNGEPLVVKSAIFQNPLVLSGQEPRDNLGPITVPPHSYFVMGDNRDNSYDSRFWGYVPANNVKGKAIIIYWSWDSENFSVRWHRIGKLLH